MSLVDYHNTQMKDTLGWDILILVEKKILCGSSYGTNSVWRVTNGSGLLLRDGTKLSVDQDKQIALLDGGYISAIGVEARPVVVKGTEDVEGYWKGIYIAQSAEHSSKFENVSIGNSGSYTYVGSQPASLYLGQMVKLPSIIRPLILMPVMV